MKLVMIVYAFVAPCALGKRIWSKNQVTHGIVKEGLGACVYNEETDVNNDETSDLGSADPRATGFFPRLRQLGRALIDHRLIALELNGEEARDLTLSLYGIIVSAVPRRCFTPLKKALEGMHKLIERQQKVGSSMKNIKKQKQILLRVVRELPKACPSHPDVEPALPEDAQDEQVEIGKAAAKRLQYLRWGYWGTHALPDYMGATANATGSAPVLVVRVFDEKRMKEGNLRLRQIWFYAKLHLLMSTEVSLRMRMGVAKGGGRHYDIKELRNTMKQVLKLEQMRHARLEFIEYDGKRHCESAKENEVNNLLAILNTESGSFKAVLMFRERYWQHAVKAAGKFFAHPILSIKKWGSRTANEWKGTTNGHKVGMILKSIVKIASIAGIVLGVVTMGATTFTTLIVDAIFAAGSEIAAFFATEASIGAVVLFLAGKLAGGPVNNVISNKILENAEALSFVQHVLTMIDDDGRFKDVIKARLDEECERIMQDEDVTTMLASLKPVESPDDDDIPPEMVKDEVERYVHNLVVEGWVAETVPMIAELIRERQMQADPSFGWQPWTLWFIVRDDGNSKALKGKEISYVDPSGRDSFKGVVQEISSKKGPKSVVRGRLLGVNITGQSSLKEVRLTMAVKFNLQIKDVEVWKKLNAEWMSWFDWRAYRGSGNALALQGKAIRLDTSLPSCYYTTSDFEGQFGADECIIRLLRAEHPAFVTTAHWKTLGLGTRKITIAFSASSVACSFRLTDDVKRCMKIQDRDTHMMYVADTARRHAAERWAKGELSTTLVDQALRVHEELKTGIGTETLFEIEQEMRCASENPTPVEQARAGNAAIAKRYGFSSEELLKQAVNLAPEEVNLDHEDSNGHTTAAEELNEAELIEAVYDPADVAVCDLE